MRPFSRRPQRPMVAGVKRRSRDPWRSRQECLVKPKNPECASWASFLWKNVHQVHSHPELSDHVFGAVSMVKPLDLEVGWGNGNNVTFQVQSSRPTVVLNAPHVSKHIRHTKRFSRSVRLSYSAQLLSLLPSIKGGLSRCVFLMALLLLNISHTPQAPRFNVSPWSSGLCVLFWPL